MKVEFKLALFFVPFFYAACSSQSTFSSSPQKDLIGTWVITGDFFQSGDAQDLNLHLNQIKPVEEAEDIYTISGCMQSEPSDGWAPLSMQAVIQDTPNEYEVNIIGTLINPESDPPAAIVHFTGNTKLLSQGLEDDLTEGKSYSIFGETAWRGSHVDAKIIECPEEFDSALNFQGEVRNVRDLAFSPPIDSTLFLAESNIVSKTLQVEDQSGNVLLIPYATDIFSPQIDFIDTFRFTMSVEGAPALNQEYLFKLLDINGNPIPGVKSIDTFLGCELAAPNKLQMNFESENYLEISWDEPEFVEGLFNPMNGNGLYQISIMNYPEGREIIYGAELYGNVHQIPWREFEPGDVGLPDGWDYGISLSELEDGFFSISVTAYTYYEPTEGENGFDCMVLDSSQNLVFEKSGLIISQFEP